MHSRRPHSGLPARGGMGKILNTVEQKKKTVWVETHNTLSTQLCKMNTGLPARTDMDASRHHFDTQYIEYGRLSSVAGEGALVVDCLLFCC